MTEYVYSGDKYPRPLRVMSLMIWDAIKAVLALGVIAGLLYLFFTHLAWVGCLVLGVLIVVGLVGGAAWIITKIKDWYDDAWVRLVVKKKRNRQ